MAAKKELFSEERPKTPCANPSCRYPGRLWVRTLAHDKRLCVNHYYDAIDRDYSLAHDDTVPPRTKMLGVTAKAVSGE